jgi:hypothetical protein
VSEPGKKSAIGDMAAKLAAEGTSVALTGAGGENPAAEDGAGDLFAGLDQEFAAFDCDTIAPPAPAKRGAGRPKGSPNRSTLQLQRYLMSRGYRDPAEFLAATMSMDTRALAAKLAGHADTSRVSFNDALDVLDLQRRAAGELLPYFHKRLPQAVELTGDGARPLIMIMDGPTGITSAVDGSETMSAFDLVEYQEVSATPADKSHDARSHDDD